MDHIRSEIIVMQTNDYDRFHMVTGNRTLNLSKIKKILAVIERGTNLLPYCPILVVERENKLDIIDGQHRFMISKKTGNPVYYIIATNLSLYEIASMNSNTEKWKPKDFINCYTQLGNEHYKKLESLLEKYPGLPTTSGVVLLLNGKAAAGGGWGDVFQRGEFTVNHEEYANRVLSFVDQFNFPAKFTRPFLSAICKIVEANIFPIDQIVKKVNDNIDMLKVQDHPKKYLTNLEEIVGKGKQSRVNIY